MKKRQEKHKEFKNKMQIIRFKRELKNNVSFYLALIIGVAIVSFMVLVKFT